MTTKLRTRTRTRSNAGRYAAPPSSASHYNHDDDDVLTSPASTPSEKDYIEIFGGFRASRGASAVPILDLLPVEENEALFDFTFLDYSEVFGGLNGVDYDYAVPFQKLFQRSNGGYASSSDDAWTHVETECLSEEWDGSSYFSKCKGFGNECSQQTIDDGKQFNVSYQKKHQNYDTSVSNTAHVAPVTAVPGYAFVIDQTGPSQKIGLQNSRFGPGDDGGQVIKRGKKKGDLPDKFAVFHETVELEKQEVQNGTRGGEKYVTISEINLQTQPSYVPPPSRPPPIFVTRDEYSSEATSTLAADFSSKFLSESSSGNNSPPFVDVEVDVRFVAATYGATATESANKSQAKANTNKENLQDKNVIVNQVNACPKAEANCNVTGSMSHNYSIDLEDSTCSVGDDVRVQHSSRKGSYSVLNSSQPLPNIMVLNPIFKLTGKKKSKKSWSSEDSCETHSSGKWAEVPEFFELVRPGMTKTTKPENRETMAQQNKIMECGKEEKRVSKQENIKARVIRSNKSEDYVKISESGSEVNKKDENHKEVRVSLQTAHQREEVERKISVGDIHKEEDIFIEIMKNKHEIEELNEFERKVKLSEEKTQDSRKNHEVRCAKPFVVAEDDPKVNDDLLRGQGDMRASEIGQQASFLTTEGDASEIHPRKLIEQVHNEMRKEAHNDQQNERVREINIDQETQEPFLRGTFEDEENLDKQKMSDEMEERKNQLKEELILEETKRRSREISEMEENKRRMDEEDYVTKLMEASENEAEEMLKEALENVKKRILIEDLERAERERKMKDEAERLQNHKISDQFSRSKDAVMLEHTDEKEREVIKKTHEDPNMMTGIRGNSKSNPDIGADIKARNHRSYKTEKLNEEMLKVLSSGWESEQNNVKSTHESISGVGKQSNYMQGPDGGMNLEYIPVADTNEQLSATKENKTLLNGNSMRNNGSGEAGSHSDQIGVESNHKLPRNQDTRNLQEEVNVGKVAMPGKANVASPDELNIDKNKLAQKVNGEISNGGRSESIKSHKSDGRKQTQNLPQESKEKSRNDSIRAEEREKAERLRREREIELEHLRKLEEEWEREREREKDRVAFESVTHNVRESAYAGLREKSAMDKATAEARQRELAKARERLEKACSEAKEKSYSEARERADRFISSSAAVYPSASMYTDKGGGIEGESMQRCKARIERHQRTAERAAKALAEKNTRDLIAQREQAERQRLAESLDAEVKRWANGKQGNLRALLSTLQYILGAESGWQPVHLTEIITSAAVKKAYRKATLCVHPDKLQQRRATIQQKYICEKVFDLLKDAWNRFNSEER